MTKDEVKRIKRYLYSIKATEIAISNLNKAIENHIGRKEAEMRITPSMSLAPGGSGGSKIEDWVEFTDTYQERLDFLNYHLDDKQERLNEYKLVMDALAEEGDWGNMAVQIIRHKYYQHVRPDYHIYTMFLFCSKQTFYRTHGKMLKYFYDTMPHRFMGRKEKDSS